MQVDGDYESHRTDPPQAARPDLADGGAMPLEAGAATRPRVAETRAWAGSTPVSFLRPTEPAPRPDRRRRLRTRVGAAAPWPPAAPTSPDHARAGATESAPAGRAAIPRSTRPAPSGRRAATVHGGRMPSQPNCLLIPSSFHPPHARCRWAGKATPKPLRPRDWSGLTDQSILARATCPAGPTRCRCWKCC